MAKAAKKAPVRKLDIFRTLEQIDRRNKDFYEKLDEDEQKGFFPPIILRWLSAVPDQGGKHAYYLHMVNELVNKDLWQLSGRDNHDQLIYKLMAMCGTGRKERHEWLKIDRTKSKIDQFLMSKFPGSNALEIKLIKRQLDKDSFKDLVQKYAMPEKEEKALIAAWKKEQK